MKVAILPYKASNLAHESEEQKKRAKQLVVRLVQFLGKIPSGSKIACDHWNNGRRISTHLEAEAPGITTDIYAWLNPGARKRANKSQIEQLIVYNERLDVPILCIIVPASLGGAYAEQIAGLLKIKDKMDFQGLTSRGIVILDAKAVEAVRLIAV